MQFFMLLIEIFFPIWMCVRMCERVSCPLFAGKRKPRLIMTMRRLCRSTQVSTFVLCITTAVTTASVSFSVLTLHSGRRGHGR